MGFELRPFQQTDTSAIRLLTRRHDRVLYCLPTGGGKSVCLGWMAQQIRGHGRKILILVHRRELVMQFMNTLREMDLADDVGIICSGYTPTPWAPIQLAMVFTFARRENSTFIPDVIFVDEAHHVRASSWEKVLSRFPNAKVIGVTATPMRLDGKALGTHFEAMHVGPSIPELVDMHCLAPTRVLRVPTGFSRKGIRKTAGDYNRSEMDKRADARVVGNSVAAYMKHIPGRRTVMFGVTKRHARVTAEKFQSVGVRAAYVGDDTESSVRAETFRRFADGNIDVICNVSLVDEGFDVPACDAVMDVSHTCSVTRFLQRAGRQMRYMPGKTGTFLDMVGNSYMHGLPDEVRHWSLDKDDNGELEERAPRPQSLRSCARCLTVFRPTISVCPHCGAEHDGRPVSEVDVELIEVLPKAPKPPPKPKMTARERGKMLSECHRHMALNEPRAAWKLLRDAQKKCGYPRAWTEMMGEMLKIPRDARN